VTRLNIFPHSLTRPSQTICAFVNRPFNKSWHYFTRVSSFVQTFMLPQPQEEGNCKNLDKRYIKMITFEQTSNLETYAHKVRIFHYRKRCHSQFVISNKHQNCAPKLRSNLLSMIICLKQVHISIVGKELNHVKGALKWRF